MKGVKYNLSMDLPQGEIFEQDGLNMSELCETIVDQFEKKYYINIKCNNQIIYNLINRPQTSNKILNEKIRVIKV